VIIEGRGVYSRRKGEKFGKAYLRRRGFRPPNSSAGRGRSLRPEEKKRELSRILNAFR